MSPREPSGALLRGSCLYGNFDRSRWPYWSVASVSAHNYALLNKGSNGCGACLEVSCSGSVSSCHRSHASHAGCTQLIAALNLKKAACLRNVSKRDSLHASKFQKCHQKATLRPDGHGKTILELEMFEYRLQHGCAQLKAGSPQPVVFVGDICWNCPPGQISIHVSFFNHSIGNASSGALPIQFRQVQT